MKLDELTASDVVRQLGTTESTALSAVAVHVVTCQSTDLITSNLLAVPSTVHVCAAFNPSTAHETETHAQGFVTRCGHSSLSKIADNQQRSFAAV